jgi:hypothetical protein
MLLKKTTWITSGAENVLYKVFLTLKWSLFWNMSRKKTTKNIRKPEKSLHKSDIVFLMKFVLEIITE